MSRDRITFQSQYLYAGLHEVGNSGEADLVPSPLQKVDSVFINSETKIDPVEEFGKLAALGYSSIEEPEGVIRFEYLVGKGQNEKALGFNTDGTENFINIGSGYKRNFYLLTVAENKDAVQTGNYSASEREKHLVVGLGNGVISNFTVSAEVGNIAKTITDWEGKNVVYYSGSSGISNPAIDDSNCPKSGTITLNAPTTESAQTPLLRPEDINVDFGLKPLAQGGAPLPGNSGVLSEVQLQNFSIDVEFDTEEEAVLGRGSLGNIKVPVNINFSCKALLTDLYSGNLMANLCNAEPRDIVVNLKPPCVGCSGANTNNPNMKYIIKGAVFEGQAISSTLFEPLMVDLRFASQLGGPKATARGLLISGNL
jgi:hypothetical protein